MNIGIKNKKPNSIEFGFFKPLIGVIILRSRYLIPIITV